MPHVHSVGLLLAEFDCTGPLHNFFRHDVATLVRLQQKECVIGVYSSAVSKPANTACWHEPMNAAIAVDPKGIP